MKKGEEYDLDITDMALGGGGIARHEGRVIFVPFTIPGEKVRVVITEIPRRWARARVRKILVPSPDRQEAPCPYFTRCGGCAYQHIAYSRQLEIKTRQVFEALRRIGKIPDPPVEPARPSPHEYHYRNRITVHVRPPAVGFHGTNPHHIVDVDQCLLAKDSVNAALSALRAKKHLRPGPATLRANPHHGGFRQVNDEAAEALAEVVAELTGTGDVLIDAYCGAGFFAKKLLGSFKRVLGIDWDVRSTDAARSHAESRETYLTGDTAELLAHVLAEQNPSVVLLDPPAQGLEQSVLDILLAAPPPRLVYVSCDPATLARDLGKLSSHYRLQRAIPVDMFPQTSSIETATLLQPQGSGMVS